MVVVVVVVVVVMVVMVVVVVVGEKVRAEEGSQWGAQGQLAVSESEVGINCVWASFLYCFLPHPSLSLASLIYWPQVE